MSRYIRLDTDALDALPPAEAYRAATQIHHQAKALGAAYADRLAATLADQHGQQAAADMLGIHQSTLAKRVTRHKKEMTMKTITRSEDPTQLPALSHMYRDSTLYVSAITEAGPVADAAWPTTDPHDALEQLTEEIAPWMPTLEALREEARSRDTARSISTEIRWTLQAEGPADEDDRENALEQVIARHRTPADRGDSPIQVADMVVARLHREADQSLHTARETAPGEVPELLLWTTPRSLSGSARPLAGWIKGRLS